MRRRAIGGVEGDENLARPAFLQLEAELERSEKMLNNPNFVNKAPEAKVNAEKAKQAEYKAQYADVLKTLEEINK